MAVTVVGSIAYDQVKTPFGERERMLGGAATHFALAASFFEQVMKEDSDRARTSATGSCASSAAPTTPAAAVTGLPRLDR